MTINPITSYKSFIQALKKTGFSLAGANKEGIFSLCDYFADQIKWHTDIPDTDPWAWRMMSIQEDITDPKDQIIYGKVFFNKGGYITGKWYPYFYAVRRDSRSFDQLYESGNISHMAKRIYDIVRQNPNISLQEIKLALNATKEDKSPINTALTKLQAGLFITISGQTFKVGKDGKPYGWPVTIFSTVEDFVHPSIIEKASTLNPNQAYARLEQQILLLNPKASDKKIKKFIG